MASLSVATWNIAAINNNPFEYWITHKDPAYNTLMEGVQAFIDSPGAHDVAVKELFSEAMFADLCKLLTEHGIAGVEGTRSLWESDYSKRLIVSGFLKDKDIGDKRLASMPDRITNTINTLDAGIQCRPTVINMYEGELASLDAWWEQWKNFFFEIKVTLQGRSGPKTSSVCQLLEPITHAKYPAISLEEEKISLPLQCLCQAVFDAILVHIMNTLAPGKWHAIKLSMCSSLNTNKLARTVEILEQRYSGADVVFLQEAAASFITYASTRDLGERFTIFTPRKLDAKRDQNSLILLRKDRFKLETAVEVTPEVEKMFAVKSPISDGDLFVLKVSSSDGVPFLLASFHGDTDGLATIPVVTALLRYEGSDCPTTTLLCGLDANSHCKGKPGKSLSCSEFCEFYSANGLTSCWGDNPVPADCLTTYNSRTYLQPQLNKAVPASEKKDSPLTDRNPKDFILFRPSSLACTKVARDNTGDCHFINDIPFPTLSFPSDHAVLSATLTRVL